MYYRLEGIMQRWFWVGSGVLLITCLVMYLLGANELISRNSIAWAVLLVSPVGLVKSVVGAIALRQSHMRFLASSGITLYGGIGYSQILYLQLLPNIAALFN
jgi:hypothetical protein